MTAPADANTWPCTAVDLAGTNFVIAAPYPKVLALVTAIAVEADPSLFVEVPVLAQSVEDDEDWNVRPGITSFTGLELATPWIPKTDDIGDVGMAIAVARKAAPALFRIVDQPSFG